MKDYATKNRRAYLKNFQPLEQACSRKNWELRIVSLIFMVLIVICLIK